MKTYEYRILEAQSVLNFHFTEEGCDFGQGEFELNELGRQGFRVVFVAIDPGRMADDGNSYRAFPPTLILEREDDHSDSDK